MGEMAEYLINGDDCESCGQHLGQGFGFPRSCCDENHPGYIGNDCVDEDDDEEEACIEDIALSAQILHDYLKEYRENNSKEFQGLAPHAKEFFNNLEKSLNEYFGCDD